MGKRFGRVSDEGGDGSGNGAGKGGNTPLYHRAQRMTLAALGWELVLTGAGRAAGGTGGGAARVLAVAVTLPVVYMLRHLIGSRRGPLLDIAAGLACVAAALQAAGLGVRLLVLPRLAAEASALPGGQARDAAALVVTAVARTADTVGTGIGAGLFGAAWLWVIGGMMVRSDRFPDALGRLGIGAAAVMLAGALLGGDHPALRAAAEVAPQAWFGLLAALLVRRLLPVGVTMPRRSGATGRAGEPAPRELGEMRPSVLEPAAAAALAPTGTD